METKYLKRVCRSVLGVGAIALITAGSTAYAADPGKWNFQVYGGWYFAGDLQALNDVEGGLDNTLDALGIEPGDDVTFGARLGKRVSDSWGWEFSAGFFDVDEAAERLENQAALDLGLGLYDLSLMFYPGGGNFYLYGGVGAATVAVKVEKNGVVLLDEDQTEASMNAGLGYVFDVGETAFIRLDGKFRYYNSDYYEGPDSEITAALGWNF